MSWHTRIVCSTRLRLIVKCGYRNTVLLIIYTILINFSYKINYKKKKINYLPNKTQLKSVFVLLWLLRIHSLTSKKRTLHKHELYMYYEKKAFLARL